MTTFKARWTLLGVAVFAAANVVSAARAKDELPKAVRNVLSEESQISRSDWNRRQQLGDELGRAKSDAEKLRWHAGYVETADGWKPVEELGSPKSQNDRLATYLQKRQTVSRNSEDQWKLASWCLSNDLRDRGEAHLFQSVLLAPAGADTSEQLKRLRYRMAGQKLVSPVEYAELEREAEIRDRDHNQWLSRVSRIVASVRVDAKNQPVPPSRTNEIEHNAAVPAIEHALTSANEAQSKVLVDVLGRTRSYRAAQTLARLAILSPSLAIRDAAIEALRTRKKDDFVPDLIGLLKTPVEHKVETAVGPRGEQYSRFVWAQEDATTIQLIDFRLFDRTTASRWTYVTSFRNPEIRGIHYIPNQPADIAKLHQIRKSVIDLDALADRANDQTVETNERVSSVLGVVCDSPNRSTPQDWWSWWAEYEDVEPSPKRTVIVKEENQQVGRIVPPTMRISCLVSGTPIWTEHGLMPIDQVQIGDRVLSKNVETGELALKPVLHTTYRPPRKTTRFVLGDDSIQATGGHRFWVSGSGWTRTRELAADQPMHTTTGTTRITAVEIAEESSTYNLVVADFHTYFVGKSGILSHDVLPPKPTNKVVPGLSDD